MKHITTLSRAARAQLVIPPFTNETLTECYCKTIETLGAPDFLEKCGD